MLNVKLGVVMSNIIEITDSMPHYEYGIYRMLFVMLMDIYRPDTIYEIEDILDDKCFDIEKIYSYISECNSDGERFDLLDEKYPFMQCGTDQWPQDAKIKSPANLSPVYATGNNHIHFDHCQEKDKTMALSEAAKAVCSVNLFCTAGAQGYPSTPSGAPPIYSIIKGQNLFETLVYGMIPIKYDKLYERPLWRSKEKTIAKKELAKISLLEGLTLPCRRIRILCDTDGIVSAVLFEQGLNYVGYTYWEDPYVTYYQTKSGRKDLKPDIDKETWRNLDTLLNCHDNNSFTRIVKQYMDLDYIDDDQKLTELNSTIELLKEMKKLLNNNNTNSYTPKIINIAVPLIPGIIIEIASIIPIIIVNK